MSMTLSMIQEPSIRQVQKQLIRQEIIPVSGGMAQSLFPILDVLLHDFEYRKSFMKIFEQKRSSTYRSFTDWFVAEIIPFEKLRIFSYYKNRSPRLQYLIDRKTRDMYEDHLVRCLLICHELRKESLNMSPEDFLEFVGSNSIVPISPAEKPIGDDIAFLEEINKRANIMKKKIKSANRWFEDKK